MEQISDEGKDLKFYPIGLNPENYGSYNKYKYYLKHVGFCDVHDADIIVKIIISEPSLYGLVCFEKCEVDIRLWKQIYHRKTWGFNE